MLDAQNRGPSSSIAFQCGNDGHGLKPRADIFFGVAGGEHRPSEPAGVVGEACTQVKTQIYQPDLH